MILDEPTTGLDPQARRSIWEFIQEIHRQGRTIVLTTHYMEEAQTLCQRVAIMDAGAIVALDTPANLIRRLPVPYRIHVGGESPLPFDELRGLETVQELQEGQDGDCYLLVTDSKVALAGLLAWSPGEHDAAVWRHLHILPASDIASGDVHPVDAAWAGVQLGADPLPPPHLLRLDEEGKDGLGPRCDPDLPFYGVTFVRCHAS